MPEDDLIIEDVDVEEIQLKSDYTSEGDMVDHRQKQKANCFWCEKEATKWLFIAHKSGLSYDEDDVLGFCTKHFTEIMEYIKKRREAREKWKWWQKVNK